MTRVFPTPEQPETEPLSAQIADLARLETEGRRRSLIPRAGLDFASNDYLGLAASGALEEAARKALDRGVPVGSGGSRLLRGNCAEHEALEAEAAAFFGAESALFLSSGFVANSALFATLPQRGDLVLADELVHASCHEGLKLTRAERKLVPHGDVQAFEDALLAWRAAGNGGQVWLAVESLYSMDGDCGPVAELGALAKKHGAMLLVDEAHATGVYGPGGRGLAAEAGLQGRSNVITLHTCGKALGCEGALLVGPAAMKDFLVNRARGFIFSTAPSPLMAAVVREALRICAGGDHLRAALQARIAKAGALLGPLGAEAHGSPVLPLVLGDNLRTMQVAERLQAQGFDVRGIRPPTVPAGTSRLRIVITLNSNEDDIAALAAALKEAL
ncbi:MAG: 8-amino-7-oxononanoate synthase [Sphingomonadaceae bacterium]|nr:8-amino-7-oxononanoate synthase [Sphingomonadaceae bacterium]